MNSSKNIKVIIPGGNGFIGQSFVHLCQFKNYQPVVLSRKYSDKDNYYLWDGRNRGRWQNKLDGADAIVNLTGRSINCRLTKKNKNDILNSRVEPIQILSKVINELKSPPKVWIQASSVGIYGNTNKPVDESSRVSNSDFFSNICNEWESTFLKLNLPETRKVILRIGWVLGRNGGVLQPIIRLTEKGMGGRSGSGKQMISWIHQEDLNQLIERAMKEEKFEGIYNAVSPNPVSNQSFMNNLRKLCHQRVGPPIPLWAVHLGALFMGTSPELILGSKHVQSLRLKSHHFEYKFPNIEKALKQILY